MFSMGLIFFFSYANTFNTLVNEDQIGGFVIRGG